MRGVRGPAVAGLLGVVDRPRHFSLCSLGTKPSTMIRNGCARVASCGVFCRVLLRFSFCKSLRIRKGSTPAQTNYLIAGCSAEVDFLDYPGDPHKGTHAAAIYDRYHAQDDNSFSFHRLSAAAEHYVPFLNQKRVIAIRALTELSFHSGDQAVPFYLQATLGGDDTLRGFRRYRFYDENAIAFNAEYRWEINTGFDMALFADFGKVFNRPSEISLAGMETSGGFGFRFKTRKKVVVRLDTGFSHEGFQVWLKFGRPF